MAYGNYAPFYRMGYLNPMQPPIQAPIDNQNMYYQPPMAQPMPIPAYPSCNPWAASYGCNSGCGGF